MKTVDQTWQAEILTEKEERSAGGHLKQKDKLKPSQNSELSESSNTVKKVLAFFQFFFLDQLELEGHIRKTEYNKYHILIAANSLYAFIYIHGF